MHRPAANITRSPALGICFAVLLAPWLSACDGQPQHPIRSAEAKSLVVPASLSAASLPTPPQPSIEPSVPRSRPMSGADAALASLVEQAILTDPELRGLGIDVSAVDGTIYLRGSARTRESRRLAMQLASSIDGVKRVQNELYVAAGL